MTKKKNYRIENCIVCGIKLENKHTPKRNRFCSGICLENYLRIKYKVLDGKSSHSEKIREVLNSQGKHND